MRFVAGCLITVLASSAFGATRYVDVNSGSPAPPYTSWTNAAKVIQEAVDVSSDGDEIVVTNGTYAAGGRTVHSTLMLTNRVAVDKALTVRSVNGPKFTTIKGYRPQVGEASERAVRCVYLAAGARLSGFTLTGGATLFDDDNTAGGGGGIWCDSLAAVVSDCVISNNAGYRGGGAFGGTLNNCVLVSNAVSTGHWERQGGGAYRSALNNCTLTGNLATMGGGAYGGTLTNCTLHANFAGSGGGVYSGILHRCTLTANKASSGGGAAGKAQMSNCTLADNIASSRGGGAHEAWLNNCFLTGNSAREGGGVWVSSLRNCTVTGNSASDRGGGACGVSNPDLYEFSSLMNCVVYFNTAPSFPNHDASFLSYTCTTPAYAGQGNISLDPRLASASHLSADSPCRGAGSPEYASGADIDGEPWATPPSMGCDEYSSGAATGSLNVRLSAPSTNIAAGFPVQLSAIIQGRASANRWEFGDGLSASNRTGLTHAWDTPGDYEVVVHAYNEDYPEGIRATATVHVVARPVHYVSLSSTNPVAPYTSWATAATNIQDAVDAVVLEGSEVVVNDGLYNSGGRQAGFQMTNRVAVSKAMTLRSLNGPRFTIIQGMHSVDTNSPGVRCVGLASGAILSGFTLTNGVSRDGSGGGVAGPASAVVSNCVLVDNWALFQGGGAYGCTLRNCTLSNNWAGDFGGGGGAHGCILYNCSLMGNSTPGSGGGASQSTLYSCTVTGNSARSGGGACFSALTNCIVYYNAARDAANFSDCTFAYSCTTPDPGGVGNITGEPQLATGSHLSPGSPCRGAGNPNHVSGVDIDGEDWKIPPSIGCDEYHPGQALGPIRADLSLSMTNVAAGFSVALTAIIDGQATASVWDFGDGVTATNQPYVAHAWAIPGLYVVRLRAYSEAQPGGIVATASVQIVEGLHYVAADSKNPLPPYLSWSTAATNIQDAVDVTEPGGTVIVGNGTYATGGRAVHGTMTNRVAVYKPLHLRSVNGPEFTVIEGRQVPGTTNGDAAIRCVYLTTGASLNGFTLTRGATRNSGNSSHEWWGGGVWCESEAATISNCLLIANSSYGSGNAVFGGTLNSCTIVSNSGWGTAASESTLNDCAVTSNNCGGAYDCTLNNCIVRGNSAPETGGGAARSTLNNCLVLENSAGICGGGVWGGTLFNCVIFGNSAGTRGGGACASVLSNCSVVSNSAGGTGGGVYGGSLNNSIIYFNTASQANNYDEIWTWLPMTYSCTTPQPTNGFGNITNAPMFVDLPGGNLRLQRTSPCINAGVNSHAPGPADLDGNPRIVSGTVDLGAYEFQGSGSMLSYAWVQRYGLLNDGTSDYVDSDADGLNNWQEWRSGTNPTNALSGLRILTVEQTGTSVNVTWQSADGVMYFLERSTNFGPASFTPLVTNLLGREGTMTYTDTNAVSPAARSVFYRLGVSPP